MFRYILMRLGYFVLTFIVVSLALFALSRFAPGDPVDKYMENEQAEERIESYASYLERRRAIAKSHHLDQAPFYFSVLPQAIPRNIFSIPNKQSRKWYKQLIYKYGKPTIAKQYIDQVQQLELLIAQESTNSFIQLKNELAQVKYHHDVAALDKFSTFLSILKFKEKPQLQQLQQAMLSNVSSLFKGHHDGLHTRLLIPKIMWHGTANQYHHWISNFVKGDFGISDFDRRPVKTRIWDALGWTLLINIVSIFLAYLISIPLGVYTADPANAKLDKTVSIVSMMLYALPSFWVATLAITFFTSDDWLHWFPSGGLGHNTSGGMARFFEVAYHLVLPILCVTYLALAFIIHQVRGAMQDTLDQDFIKTAQAKGLPNNEVIWKHGFRNSLLSLVTMFSNILPATIAGSIVVEIIFSIPGMGRLALQGILQQDWNVVFTIMMMTALFTLVGNLLADLFYQWVDPRISLTKPSQLGA